MGLLSAAAILLALWLIPGGQILVLPLQWLNTHLHETCHAIASLLTAGQVGNIDVYANGSGVTGTYMDHPVIVSSAGYVGSSIIGALVIAFSRDPKSARAALLGIASLLLIECLFWLRGDAFGMVSGFGYLVLFLILGIKLQGWPAMFVAQFVGLQQCLASLQAVLGIVNPQVLSFTDNDATILQGYTHIPAILWSVAWSLVSLILIVISFAYAWTESRPQDGWGSRRKSRSPGAP